MVKCFIMNELNQKYTMIILVIYAKKTKKHTKAIIKLFNDEGFDYEEIDENYFQLFKKFIQEV